jgi:hypothetical protein
MIKGIPVLQQRWNIIEMEFLNNFITLTVIPHISQVIQGHVRHGSLMLHH